MLVRILADEVRTDRITVNELIRGPVRTRLADQGTSPSRVMGLTEEWVKVPDECRAPRLVLSNTA